MTDTLIMLVMVVVVTLIAWAINDLFRHRMPFVMARDWPKLPKGWVILLSFCGTWIVIGLLLWILVK